MGNILGFIGAGLFVLSYFLLQRDKRFACTLHYSLMNFAGALFMLLSLFYDWNMGALINNSFWIVLSLYGMRNAFPTKRQTIAIEAAE